MAIGSCATGPREPSQGREAAALSGKLGVPQTAWSSHLTASSLSAWQLQGEAGDGVSFLGEFACVSEHKKDAPLPAVELAKTL